MKIHPIIISHDDQLVAARFDPGVGFHDLTALRTFLYVPNARATHAQVVAKYPCPYGEPGSVHWVREHTWSDEDGKVDYGGNHQFLIGKTSSDWRPESSMPRRLARMFLRVTQTALVFDRYPSQTSPIGWFWLAHIEMIRDRKGKLCPPGPDAVWRASFHEMLAHDREASSKAVIELNRLLVDEDWVALREHVLTACAALHTNVHVGMETTRSIRGLLVNHKDKLGDAWAALDERWLKDLHAVRADLESIR